MTTYGYTRVSTVEQGGDRSSIEDQSRRIRGAAMVRGVEDVVQFSDVGVTGSIPLADRPNGGVMVAGLVRGDTLIAAKLDRLFRSASDALVTVEEFQRQGIDVVLVDMGTDPVTSSGASKMFFTLLAAFAEFEKGRILERMADGRKGKARRGGAIGPAPYGFNAIGSGREAMLQPNEYEQNIITIARRNHAVGWTLRAIAEGLMRDGFYNRTGRPFDPMQVKRMLDYQNACGTIAA